METGRMPVLRFIGRVKLFRVFKLLESVVNVSRPKNLFCSETCRELISKIT
jgi:hypothetical protein